MKPRPWASAVNGGVQIKSKASKSSKQETAPRPLHATSPADGLLSQASLLHYDFSKGRQDRGERRSRRSAPPGSSRAHGWLISCSYGAPAPAHEQGGADLFLRVAEVGSLSGISTNVLLTV